MKHISNKKESPTKIRAKLYRTNIENRSKGSLNPIMKDRKEEKRKNPAGGSGRNEQSGLPNGKEKS